MRNYVKQKHDQVAHQNNKRKSSKLESVSRPVASDPVPTSCSSLDIPVRSGVALSLAAERNLCLFCFFSLFLSPKMCRLFTCFSLLKLSGGSDREEQIRIGRLGLNTSSRLSHLSTVSSIYRQTCFFCRACVSVCFLGGFFAGEAGDKTSCMETRSLSAEDST